MNVTGPIHFYNRYTEHLETEAVYGGGFLNTFPTRATESMAVFLGDSLAVPWEGWRFS